MSGTFGVPFVEPSTASNIVIVITIAIVNVTAIATDTAAVLFFRCSFIYIVSETVHTHGRELWVTQTFEWHALQQLRKWLSCGSW